MDVGAGAFAFVMATGILSVAAAVDGFPVLSRALFVLAAAAYVALAAALRLRVFREHSFAPFAFVAASGVLGTRFVVAEVLPAGIVLLAIALAAWLVLVGRRRPPAPAPPILLVVVGTQAVAVLAGSVARGDGATTLLVAALAWWALGLLGYLLVVALLARRRPTFSPDLWVLMGALAIATLAAGQVAAGARVGTALAAARGGVADAGIATWIVATSLIPMLTAVDLRRHAHWRYDTSRWSFVFPLGMYATASQVLGNAVGWHALVDVGRDFFFVALAAWAAVGSGLARRAWHVARTRRA